MKKDSLFRHAATALITPFARDKIDFSAFSRLIEYQLEGGVRTLVVCGTTGESATLSAAEKSALFSFAVSEYGKNATVIAGCGTCDTAYSATLCRMAASAGVHGILAVTPYYNKPTPEGIYRHFRTLSEATDLPIVVYTVPGRTGTRIDAPLWAKLSELSHVVGIKDAGGDIAMTARYLQASPLPLYSGNDDSILPTLSLGGAGCISVLSNLMPARVQALCEACEEGNLKTAAQIQLSLLPLADALFSETNPIPVKFALSRLGFCTPQWRLPLTEPSPATQKRIEEEMEHLGLL